MPAQFALSHKVRARVTSRIAPAAPPERLALLVTGLLATTSCA